MDSDQKNLLNRLSHQWEMFIGKGIINADTQTIVAQSWEECRLFGLDPQKGLGKIVDPRVYQDIREQNESLWETARPIMQSVFEIVERSHFLLVLTDSAGYVLETIGDQVVAGKAEDLRFTPGNLWTNLEVGSNAIGAALKYDRAVQMVGAEHYCVTHHGWTCSAAPIHGLDGKVAGCLNMSSDCSAAHPHTLGLVVAAAFGIEQQLFSLHSSRLMRMALDSNSDCILLLDKHFHPVWANKATSKLLGMPGAQMKNADFREMMPEMEWAQIREWEKGGKISSNDTPLYIDGKALHCSVTVSPTLQSGCDNKTFAVVLRKQEHLIRAVNMVSGNRATYTFDSIYARDSLMKKTVALASQYARYDGVIMIEGESGTGKELFAQAIHNGSQRAEGPFVAINCASLPRELVESELFGYEKGAFTGALKDGNPGKFELANQGAIFLDEISEMPLEFQAKLLRVVETRKVRRLGGSREKDLDVRIIVAANRNLKQEVKLGRMREDLYFRLNVLKLEIPPLRERPEDILYCAERFLDHFNNRYPELRKSMSRDFERALQDYAWPGNVRELQNSIERVFFSCPLGILGTEAIPVVIDSAVPAETPLRREIREALDACGGNVEESAKRLGLSRASMYRRVKQFGINPKELRI
ncbi:MAG: sigma-54-dependent Fis family transcriptional regulator [Spirochaetales bacterium]|jgi:transcriptional regulator of acetoin/glycerol metabolism|nr:sigma-54-dependent Fis family transcriptional regulator [Spirochaetales bacterium]